MIQIIITGLAGAVGTLAGIIFKMLNDQNADLKQQIKEQRERDQQRIAMQETTTKTLQAVVDVGMERLRSQAPEQKT
jgi:dihydrodipicolinate reductase